MQFLFVAMQFLTDFADLAVVLPLAVAVGVALLASGWPRGALAWAVVVPATLLTVLLAKLVVAACGTYLPFHGLYDGFRSPSGHTASAAVVYGGLLSLLLPEPRRGLSRPFAAIAIAGVVAVLFGGTRLALHVHSRSDVLAGAALGIAGALVLARFAGPRPSRLRVAIPLAVALAVVLLFHGRHLRAEDQIDRVSHLVWPLTLCCRAR
ncbi:MAG: phosphatase PAP2 family protein [Rhodospirillales bacterium]|nr:phosphatase PAP2 family protein [Rhodospirillales bacterium]